MRRLLLFVVLFMAASASVLAPRAVTAQEPDPAMALAAEREVAHQLAAQVADLSAQSLLMNQKIADLTAKLAKAASTDAKAASTDKAEAAVKP